MVMAMIFEKVASILKRQGIEILSIMLSGGERFGPGLVAFCKNQRTNPLPGFPFDDLPDEEDADCDVT